MLIKRHIVFILIIVASFFTNVVSAQNRLSKVDSVSMEIHFRWDKSYLDTLYMGNDKTLAKMRALINQIPVEQIDSVVIVSQSSPEGTWRHNQNLSTRRAATMRKYMEEQYPQLKHALQVSPDGESWGQLREWVRTDTLLKNKSIERVLKIIDNDSILYRDKEMAYYERPSLSLSL